MLSYWEKDFFCYDIVIVGGGILGLWTGLEARKKFPQKRIAILERSFIPQGASTRNAGFSCFGSVTELWSNIETIGEAQTLEIVEKRWKGMQKINANFSNLELDYQCHGGYELIVENEDMREKVSLLNQKLQSIFHREVFYIQDEKIKEFGFQGVGSLLFNPLEGQLHSGKLVRALIDKCSREGVHYVTGADVKINGKEIYFNGLECKAKKIIITTNAFVPDFVQNIKPGRGQVLVTKPIENLKLKGTFHLDQGYYYFRNIDNRVLLGGGRNLDFETETTTAFEINERIQSDLIEKLKSMILPNHDFEIDMQWSGIMAFSDDHLPKIESISSKIIYAMNCNGMGVSLSPMTAEEICERV